MVWCHHLFTNVSHAEGCTHQQKTRRWLIFLQTALKSLHHSLTSGCNVFWPHNVQDRSTKIKRYGLIFTCLSSRAVHIEMLYDLTPDEFINRLHCFISVRGNVGTLRCDVTTGPILSVHVMSYWILTKTWYVIQESRSFCYSKNLISGWTHLKEAIYGVHGSVWFARWEMCSAASVLK